jgi:hypothetical protein
VQLRIGGVQAVQLAHAVAQSLMRRILQLRPIELLILPPLVALAEFTAHEQQLLAGMSAHVGAK